MNTLQLADFYKVGHEKMYEPGMNRLYSNNTPRKSRIPGIGHVIHFGLQYFIKKYLIEDWNNNFFQKPFEQVGREYMRIVNAAIGPDQITLDHIKELHELGYLPLRIKALPEGAKVPIRVPVTTSTNTGNHCGWLVNYLETIWSTSTWQSITSATIAYELLKTATKYNKLTADHLNFVQWQMHDFSMRGMSSLESAMMSGAAHAICFTGSDTIPAIGFLEKYYNANCEKELVLASVPATEHSVMSLGLQTGEIDTFARLLDLFPNGILSVVSDTWSLPNVLVKILPALKDKILARNGKLVIRPDSFWTNPVDCLCGFDGYHPQMDKLNDAEKETVRDGSIESLWNIFGGTINKKGYRVLDPHIGSIYGDSITPPIQEQVFIRLMNKKFSSENTVMGVGSYTYQYNTRDTFGLAIKATYGEVNGVPREICKNPVTDDGMKKSAKGFLRVDLIDGEYHLKDQCTPEEEAGGELMTVFENGVLLIDWSLEEIRQRIKSNVAAESLG